MGEGTEAMLVGLGMLAIFGFGAYAGRSFTLSSEEEQRRDYHWARAKGFQWSGLFCKYVGVPLGGLVFAVGVVASLADLFT